MPLLNASSVLHLSTPSAPFWQCLNRVLSRVFPSPLHTEILIPSSHDPSNFLPFFCATRHLQAAWRKKMGYFSFLIGPLFRLPLPFPALGNCAHLFILIYFIFSLFKGEVHLFGLPFYFPMFTLSLITLWAHFQAHTCIHFTNSTPLPTRLKSNEYT